uniref:Uncharacterized protein n=1 Tax=Arundo donax TaxID=35708 RepID=A0A0A9AFT8_ARUDO
MLPCLLTGSKRRVKARGGRTLTNEGEMRHFVSGGTYIQWDRDHFCSNLTKLLVGIFAAIQSDFNI